MLNNICIITFILLWLWLLFISLTYKYTDEIIDLIDKIRDTITKIITWFKK